MPSSGKTAPAATEERILRYTKEHKRETRQRIITTAGRRLKRDGIKGIRNALALLDAEQHD